MDRCIKYEVFLDRAIRSHSNRYEYDQSSYNGINKKIKIKCKDHGWFLQLASVHCNGSGCKQCAALTIIQKRTTTFDKFVSKAKKIHGNKYEYDKNSFINLISKTKILCKIHGQFEMLGISHVNNKMANGCPKCGIESRSIKRRTPIKKIIERANKIHKNKYDYSKIIYINKATKVEIVCNDHGSFMQTISDHITARAGCPKCNKEKQGRDQTMTFNTFVKKSRLRHGKKYKYDKLSFISAMKPTKIFCKTHGFFWQVPNAHYFGQGCPKCAHTVSKMETRWLNSLKIPKKNRNCKMPKLGKYKVDGWRKINGKITIYEFNGSFWHGDPRLFKNDSINKVTKCTFGELYDSTLKKAARILAAGYDLVTMWEEDYKSLEASVANSDLSPLTKVT